jgi:Xaa-Pro dipeptidase
MKKTSEVQGKLEKVREFLARKKLGGMLINAQNNFCWITGGREGYVVMGGDPTVGSILVTSNDAWLLTTNIEQPRFYAEEISKNDFKPLIFPWHNAGQAQKMISKVVAKGGKVVSDTGAFGTAQAGPDFARLRWQLCSEEMERYREVGHIASDALEATCRRVKPGMTEFEIASILAREVIATGARPNVILVAVDDRISKFRHPIPKETKLKRYAMLVICAKKYGLIANCTRMVHFGKIPRELRRKHDAVCCVDAAFNMATQPGAKGRDIFKAGLEAYAQLGFKNEWKLHHQGGATGYFGREWLGTPACEEVVQENQAFAWNPSIVGTKSEDTILVSREGVEVLTAASSRWPTVHVHHPDGCLERPDILVR